jgi:NOL1/NOP2/fmu family ribosome biogenesis protein
MENLKILNSKERKELAKKVSDNFGFDFEFEYEVFMNNHNRIFILNRDVTKIKIDDLRVNSLGLYFGEIGNGELRISIDGSMLIGKHATKNVLILNDGESAKWMAGEDFSVESDLNGFVIVKNNSDYLGCGKVIKKKLYNYVPKERRC